MCSFQTHPSVYSFTHDFCKKCTSLIECKTCKEGYILDKGEYRLEDLNDLDEADEADTCVEECRERYYSHDPENGGQKTCESIFLH